MHKFLQNVIRRLHECFSVFWFKKAFVLYEQSVVIMTRHRIPYRINPNSIVEFFSCYRHARLFPILKYQEKPSIPQSTLPRSISQVRKIYQPRPPWETCIRGENVVEWLMSHIVPHNRIWFWRVGVSASLITGPAMKRRKSEKLRILECREICIDLLTDCRDDKKTVILFVHLISC